MKPVFQNVSRKPCFKEFERGGISASKKKSGTYSTYMPKPINAVLTYKHDLGMNYDFVLPDLIVGSCLQTPDDVDHLKKLGVRTIFCLQQNPDLEYFGVDICAIHDRAKEIEGVEHIRAPIRDFDAYDLRIRLPSVIAILHKAVTRNGGITYIHCTAGLGRAPAVAFIGGATEAVVLKWQKPYSQNVEVSGLHVGWDQRIPLEYDRKRSCWALRCELPVGRYEYKYIVDGRWTCNPDEPLTHPDKNGLVNNYVEVGSNSEDNVATSLRQILMKGNTLSDIERGHICEKLKGLCNC